MALLEPAMMAGVPDQEHSSKATADRAGGDRGWRFYTFQTSGGRASPTAPVAAIMSVAEGASTIDMLA